MTTSTPQKKQHRALRKLVGAVAIAGATYAVEKIIEKRKKNKSADKQKGV